MAYPKGAPKPPGSGRKKGTPNKISTDILRICEEEGLDPMRALVQLATSEQWGDNRLAALKEICQYAYPKRKALEHSGEINNPFSELTLEELRALAKEKLK